MPNPVASLSENLADWACKLSLNAVPEIVIDQAKMALVDTLSVALRGCYTPLARILRRSVSGLSTLQGAGVLGVSAEKYPAEVAAQLNASFAHALDFDDSSYAGFVHASAVVIPAALALAEERGATGEQLLTAVIAGIEAELIIGSLTDRHLYDRGWWTTGVLGSIGAVVASGRLLDLSSGELVNALGLAVSGTGGIKACFGTDGKPILAGFCSGNAVRHAKLARLGATGPADVFESNHGFFQLFNETVPHKYESKEFGLQWRLEAPGLDIKEIPVCLSSHAAVEAVLSLREEYGFESLEVESIICSVPPIVQNNLIFALPETSQQAQFSLPYPISIALTHNSFRIEHLSVDQYMTLAVTELMKKIEVLTDDFWTPQRIADCPEGAVVTVRLTGGRCLSKFIGLPKGSRDKHQRWDMVIQKARNCLDKFVSETDFQLFINRLRRIEFTKTLGDLSPRFILGFEDT